MSNNGLLFYKSLTLHLFRFGAQTAWVSPTKKNLFGCVVEAMEYERILTIAQL